MRDAGFVNVHVEKKVLPIGPWPKDPRLVCVLALFLSDWTLEQLLI